LLGLGANPEAGVIPVGRGRLIYLKRSPTEISKDAAGGDWLVDHIKAGSKTFPWKSSSSLILDRGPYVVAAGMDETKDPAVTLNGRFIDLFDPQLGVLRTVEMSPDSRHFLVDVDKFRGNVIAASGGVTVATSGSHSWKGTIEGIAETNAVMVLRIPKKPSTATVDGQSITDSKYDEENHLLWLRFPNSPTPRQVQVEY